MSASPLSASASEVGVTEGCQHLGRWGDDLERGEHRTGGPRGTLLVLQRFRQFDQPLGRVLTATEQNVFDPFE